MKNCGYSKSKKDKMLKHEEEEIKEGKKRLKKDKAMAKEIASANKKKK